MDSLSKLINHIQLRKPELSVSDGLEWGRTVIISRNMNPGIIRSWVQFEPHHSYSIFRKHGTWSFVDSFSDCLGWPSTTCPDTWFDMCPLGQGDEMISQSDEGCRKEREPNNIIAEILLLLL